MARKPRMVLNREALHQVDLAMAEGLEAVALEVLSIADPNVPDAAPFGEGLIERGGHLTYVDGKKVGGDSRVNRKPRDFKVRGQGVAVAAGYTFPAKFNEIGTVHQPARPFLTPAVMSVVGNQGAVVGAMQRAFSTSLTSKARGLARLARKGLL